MRMAPLVKSIDVTRIIVDKLIISMENIYGYDSWIKVKNKKYNIIIHNMV